MEHPIPFQTLVKFVDAGNIANEENHTLVSPLEITTVTSEVESQNLSSETHDPKPEVMFTQTTDPNKKSKSQYR